MILIFTLCERLLNPFFDSIVYVTVFTVSSVVVVVWQLCVGPRRRRQQENICVR